ncbi:peritrophin-48 [Bactrocera tryoni]|uniref:peritrophin-48 n=2 Tax=Bactrocera tyroni species complex TaxID=98808 RepID=UPI001A99DAF7|nr:peritrophin-48 [Bactrocera tryoni]
MFLAKMCMRTTFTLLAAVAITAVQSEMEALTVEDICKQMASNIFILRPNSCDNWVQCPSALNGQDYDEGYCAFGLYFNKDLSRCESSEDVTCPFENTGNNDVNQCASMKDGTFLADPKNCNSYIYCTDGQEAYSNCPKDLVFHPKKGSCVYSNEYQCPKQVENLTASPICNSIPGETVFADITDCTKYQQCEQDGKLSSLQCAEGQAFNYTTLKCVARKEAVCHPLAPELEAEIEICGTEGLVREGYIADDQSCSAYYICAKQKDGKPDRKPMHLKCQEGYFFDSATWSCRDRLNVKCALDRCEGMDNKYVNVAGDCSAYARCKNGVTIASGKCDTNYYFDERTQGCTPHNISYIACSA